MAGITTERLKFYCDTGTERNKLMTWKINSIFDLEDRVRYWMKRVTIRAAWYEVCENGKVVTNQKIDLDRFTETDFKDISFTKNT